MKGHEYNASRRQSLGIDQAAVFRTSPAFMLNEEACASSPLAKKMNKKAQLTAQVDANLEQSEDRENCSRLSNTQGMLAPSSKPVLVKASTAPETDKRSVFEVRDQATEALKTLGEFLPWNKLSAAEAKRTKAALADTERYLALLAKQVETRRAKCATNVSRGESASRQLADLKSKAREKERQAEERAALQRQLPPWAPDSSRSTCTDCGSAFSIFFNPRHHCRACGLLFDAKCCSNFKRLPDLGYTENVRVCNNCSGPNVQKAPPKPVVPLKVSKQPLSALAKTPVKRPNFLAELKSTGSAGLLNNGRQRSPNMLDSPILNQARSPANNKASGKPRSVLDELRSNLVKRNSCPDLLKKNKAKDIENAVSSSMKAKRMQMANHRVSNMQPKQGTAVAQLLEKSAQKCSQDEQKRQEDLLNQSWDTSDQ